MSMIPANDPSLRSWVPVPKNSDFPIQNLPFGVFKTATQQPGLGVRIGDHILDLDAVADLGYFATLDFDHAVFHQSTLNAFMALGKEHWSSTREAISNLLEEGSSLEHDAAKVLVPITEAEMLLPITIGDYTDFYSSIEHATNVGKMFRPDNPLMPNWKHLPVAYHGRASSIVISGTPIHRPLGQMKPDGQDAPIFGPSRSMDFELEMAFVIGKGTSLGTRVSVEQAEDHIFGYMIFNDWSARDIQAWEYVPLGPFLGKNFASSLSPWVVMLEALEPFRTKTPEHDVPMLPYLKSSGNKNYDIQLEVLLKTKEGLEHTLCVSNTKYLYWDICQQLAHHTINGCNINPGDVMASGTISGPTKDSLGSLLEITTRGANPVKLADGTERKFLQDYDTIIIKAFAQNEQVRIGFGEVSGQLLPALEM